MGQQKHEMMKAEEQHGVALGIAARAGVTEYCPRHGNYSYSGGELEPAYKLGNKLFTDGVLGGVFEDRRELTDAIKSAVESCAPKCYPCAEDDD